VSFAYSHISRDIPPLDEGNDLASSVNLRSGLLAVGALRSEEGATQEPVALETTVIATGARPGDRAAKRELFTEETETVLVFEHGAVIRLSAAVADGQLLFLSNKATGKEVVTQVLRKRSFRPTNCYVDLEFTEPCPGFWGIEFPQAATAVGAPNAKGIPEQLSAAEDVTSGVEKSAAPPSLQEVDRLKHEVAELQTQLKSLLQTGENAGREKTAQSGVKSAKEIGAELARKEEEKQLEELFAMEAKQETSNLPQRLVAYPQKSSKRAALKKNINKSLIAALIIALAAAGANWLGAFNALTKTSLAAKPAASHAMFPAPAPAVQKPAVASAVPSPTPTNESANSVTVSSEVVAKDPAAGNPVGSADDHKTAVGVLGLPLNPAPRGPVKSSAGSASSGAGAEASPESKRRKGQSGSELFNRTAATASNRGAPSNAASAADASGSVGVIPGGDGYVGPRLLHAVKPVAPPEALKNYVTGNVNVDALVDSTGHIKSVTVLSGPTKLRQHAVEEMKQYVYEPAKRNGIAVSSHVQVSLQYWYEP
jgi:hypothetical protein